jgi:predicted nucleic acid-binding protein
MFDSLNVILSHSGSCIYLAQLASGLSEQKIETFVTAVIAMAEPVRIYFLWRRQLRDPGDEMVLETAVNGGADTLITFNVRHYRGVPGRFGIELAR